jgi:hypothetical protein
LVAARIPSHPSFRSEKSDYVRFQFLEIDYVQANVVEFLLDRLGNSPVRRDLKVNLARNRELLSQFPPEV